MTEEYLNLDFENNNYFDSYHQQFTTSRDSGTSSDDTHKKNDLPKTKKNISKYEPIYENNILYRYEDNPEQYKRMRKKLQNRESANRVRGRQKNYVSDLETEFKEIKLENQQLQMINAKLQAENTLLKQQVSFMQTVILKEEPTKINPPFQMERVEQNQKHYLPLSAFTMLLGLVIFNNFTTNEKEAIIAAAEQPNQITQEISSSSYLIIGLIVLWAGYALYVTYGLSKGKLHKMKII